LATCRGCSTGECGLKDEEVSSFLRLQGLLRVKLGCHPFMFACSKIVSLEKRRADLNDRRKPSRILLRDAAIIGILIRKLARLLAGSHAGVSHLCWLSCVNAVFEICCIWDVVIRDKRKFLNIVRNGKLEMCGGFRDTYERPTD
jgi:hypothetical protein